jgi:hypothetical protein
MLQGKGAGKPALFLLLKTEFSSQFTVDSSRNKGTVPGFRGLSPGV